MLAKIIRSNKQYYMILRNKGWLNSHVMVEILKSTENRSDLMVPLMCPASAGSTKRFFYRLTIPSVPFSTVLYRSPSTGWDFHVSGS